MTKQVLDNGWSNLGVKLNRREGYEIHHFRVICRGMFIVINKLLAFCLVNFFNIFLIKFHQNLTYYFLTSFLTQNKG